MVKKGKLNVNLLPAIKKLELATKKMAVSRMIGEYASIFKGRGIEFSGYREYTTNDDASLIDWKASARANEVLIREYTPEKNINVFFLLDSSHNMVFGSTQKLKIEYAVELVAALANAVLNGGNNAGVALFDSELRLRVYPSQGMKQYHIIINELVKGNYYGGAGYDIEKALKFVMNYLDEGSILIIVSDFIGCVPGWEQKLKMSAGKFDVIAMMVRDPLDSTLPTGIGQVVLQDPFSKSQVVINPELVKDVYEDVIREQERMLEKNFLEAGVDFLKLTTDKDFIHPVIGLFNERISRWR
ncbi:MAG: DUF58 domain-containing protein [Nanoarchaeota archaeon]|nr:DUF58 domain-containing protein [Nanoarchaeota archaeon]